MDWQERSFFVDTVKELAYTNDVRADWAFKSRV